jgi:hypothetical protein
MATPSTTTDAIMAQLNKLDSDLLKTSYDRTSEILASQQVLSTNQESRDHRSQQHIMDALYNTSNQGLAATERNGMMNLSATHAVGEQAERLANENISLVLDHSRAMNHMERDLSREHHNLMRDTFQLERVMRDKFDMQSQNFSKLELQAATNTAAIQLEALKNKTEIMQKFAECCCELKERITTSESSIKELVKSLDTERIRDALKAAETKNLILELNK